MKKDTITITTDLLVKDTAKAFFKKQGLTLESAITNYLENIYHMVHEDQGDKVILCFVDDEDVPEHVMTKAKEHKENGYKDFYSTSEVRHAH